jgi:hypothetical protein
MKTLTRGAHQVERQSTLYGLLRHSRTATAPQNRRAPRARPQSGGKAATGRSEGRIMQPERSGRSTRKTSRARKRSPRANTWGGWSGSSHFLRVFARYRGGAAPGRGSEGSRRGTVFPAPVAPRDGISGPRDPRDVFRPGGRSATVFPARGATEPDGISGGRSYGGGRIWAPGVAEGDGISGPRSCGARRAMTSFLFRNDVYSGGRSFRRLTYSGSRSYGARRGRAQFLVCLGRDSGARSCGVGRISAHVAAEPDVFRRVELAPDGIMHGGGFLYDFSIPHVMRAFIARF